MVKVVIVNGRPGCGKTTFEQACMKILQTNNIRLNENKRTIIDIISTVDFVKEVAEYCGWDGTKTPHNRKFLSDLKDLLTRWDDVPYKTIVEHIDDLDEFYDWIVFVDCREPSEIQKLKDKFNATTLLIRRESVEYNDVSNHADADVFNYQYDYEIYNNYGLYELSKAAAYFINSMKKEEVPHYEFRND